MKRKHSDKGISPIPLSTQVLEVVKDAPQTGIWPRKYANKVYRVNDALLKEVKKTIENGNQGQPNG